MKSIPEQLCLDLEERYDQYGWDLPPGAFIVFGENWSTKPGILPSGLPLSLFETPVDCMLAVANQGLVLTGESVLGLALVSEAWGKQIALEEFQDSEFDLERSPADDPEGFETRVVTLVTTSGDVFQASRERGHEPVSSAMLRHDPNWAHMMRSNVPYLMYILLHGEEPT